MWEVRSVPNSCTLSWATSEALYLVAGSDPSTLPRPQATPDPRSVSVHQPVAGIGWEWVRAGRGPWGRLGPCCGSCDLSLVSSCVMFRRKDGWHVVYACLPVGAWAGSTFVRSAAVNVCVQAFV